MIGVTKFFVVFLSWYFVVFQDRIPLSNILLEEEAKGQKRNKDSVLMPFCLEGRGNTE